MATPTASDVHIDRAIGKKKKLDADGDVDMGKKKMGDTVPPQFLPKQKGKGEPDGDEGKMGKKSAAKPAAKGKPFKKK